jgi:hypothetical protein
MQLLHPFFVTCIVPDDSFQYFASLAVAFAKGTLRYFCIASSSHHFITFASIRGATQKFREFARKKN